MDLPKRMAVRDSRDAIRRQWLTWLCVTDAGYGLTTMFAKSEGASQVLLREILPTPVWGAFLFVSAVLIWWGWSVVGAAFGAAAWGFFTGAALVAIFRGTALSYAGPFVLGYLCGNHVLIITNVGSGLDQDRERRQSRAD